MNSNLEQTIKLQQLASNPNNSAWVFASAGSGKTKILVDRVLRLILNGVKADKILCLTFTKVAASEMQERINKELANWVLLNDEDLNNKLKNLQGFPSNPQTLEKARTLFAKTLDDESKIKIQTIHSFCQNLVKIFPFEAGIKPNFEIIETSQEKLLLQKTQRKILKKAQSNEYLKSLITKINSFIQEDTFNKLISELLEEKEYLEQLKEEFFGIEGLIDNIFDNFLISRNSKEEEIFQDFLLQIKQSEICKLVSELKKSDLKTNLKSASEIDLFLREPSLTNFTFYQSAFLTDKKTARKLPGKILEDDFLNQVFQQQIEIIEDFTDRINSFKICTSTALLLKFVDHILEEYNEIKRQNSILDYNDLVIKANKLLKNPQHLDWVKLKLDGFFDHILIDESQDTNHQQWDIIKALTDDFFSGQGASSKNRTIFIVGDEKQSIYSFQGAEANISQEIFTYFNEKLKNSSTKLHKINLSNSFRSLSSILEVVDLTFSEEKQKIAITKISDFDGHKAIRDGVGRVEIWPKIKNQKEDKKEDSFEWEINFQPKEKYDEKDYLAELISLKIKNLVENCHILEGHNREVSYGDFMILLRNRTDGFDKSLTKFFNKYKIPYSSLSKTSFNDNIIIQDLLSAAKFALFPYDDLNLACLLKSPIFNFSEDNLLKICLVKNEKSISLFESLKNFAEFNYEFELLEQIINNSQNLNCFEFFNFILQNNLVRTNFIDRFQSNCVQIIDKFLLKTFDFCQNFSNDLHKFLDFSNKLNPEISLNESDKNCVFVSTIHSSKGLQAPIVFLPDCCFIFSKLPAGSEKISWIKFNEAKLPVWCPKKEQENKITNRHRFLQKNSAYDEYLRLLYVAMTRAENQLFIGGFGNSDDENSWYNLIKKSNLKNLSKESFFIGNFEKFKNDKFLVEDENLIFGHKELLYSGNKKEISKEKVMLKFDVYSKFNGANKKEIKSASTEFKNQISKSQNKGKLIHKVLEVIGKNYQENKEWLMSLSEKIIISSDNFNKDEKKIILLQIINFINSKEFDYLFSGKTSCELPIAGLVENKIVNARIDLLSIKENYILIMDYKTDKTKFSLANSVYEKQLETYKKLVSQIYTNYHIKTAILWTEFLEIEFLNQ
ncbi:MAG: hypothetical protein FJ368_01405 [Pelagibacterales bacterium]|nr:hypothetical protein [Pelagibacterales bacterium]